MSDAKKRRGGAPKEPVVAAESSKALHAPKETPKLKEPVVEDSQETPKTIDKAPQSKSSKVSKNIHVKNRPSLLSLEAGDQNFRGLINLAGIVLVVGNARLVVENLLKYGLLIDFPSANIEKWPSTWPCLTCTLCLPLFPLFSHLIEVAAFSKFIPSLVARCLHILNITCTLLIPIFITHVSAATLTSGSVLVFLSVVMFLKLISYAHISTEIRWIRSNPNLLAALQEQNALPKEEEQLLSIEYDVDLVRQYKPHLRQLFYFLAAPTLCFQLSYPRSPRVRTRFLLRRVSECLFCFGLMFFIAEQYMVPGARNSIAFVDEMKLGYLFERILKLSIPNLAIWLLMFYGLFHSFLNLTAELLCFGDRLFYKDWWNATNLEEYWKLWNLPVHNFLVRHLYTPTLKAGLPKGAALSLVFFFSAVLHEVLVSVPCHSFNLWAFYAMMFQVPLIAISKFMNQRVAATWGNVFFWTIFCIFGQPTIVLLYYHDYVRKYDLI